MVDYRYPIDALRITFHLPLTLAVPQVVQMALFGDPIETAPPVPVYLTQNGPDGT
jgi:hypothetical protein